MKKYLGNINLFLIIALLFTAGPPTIEAAKRAVSHIQIVGADEALEVDVLEIDGRNRILTDSRISSVNVPLGKDPFPDTYFTIEAAGQIGDTITINIAATTFDPTNPVDVNLPAYTYTYTLVAADVGNERQLAVNLADALNADLSFENQFLEAEAINGDLRPVIHITSTEYSLNGESYERPNIGDFTATPTGTTQIKFFSTEFNTIVSRPKEVSLGRDPNNPHRLGVQAISGTVFIRSSDPDRLIRERIEEVGSPGQIELNVNGNSPKVFEFSANPDGGPDKIIDSLKFFGNDGNIKTQTGNFLGLNSALSNGILIEFVREGAVIFSENITNTIELLALWSTSASDNKIINQSGGDYFESTFSLVDRNLAFVLENGEDSKVRVTIRDNLSQIDALFLLIDGSED